MDRLIPVYSGRESQDLSTDAKIYSQIATNCSIFIIVLLVHTMN